MISLYHITLAGRRLGGYRAGPQDSRFVYGALTLITPSRGKAALTYFTQATPTLLLTAHKPHVLHAGRLVAGWVTTSESLLLYVFVPLLVFYYVFFTDILLKSLSAFPALQQFAGGL